MIRVFHFALAGLLAGCISQPPVPSVDRGALPQAAASQLSGPDYYTVKRGDTLFRIAMESGQDYRDIAGWNNIVDSATIKEGQILRVTPPVAAAPGGAVVATPVPYGSGIETRALEANGPTAPEGSFKREPKVGKEPYSDEAYARLNRLGELAAVRPPETPAELKPAPEPVAAAPVSGPNDVPWIWPTSGKIVVPFSDAGNKGLDLAGQAGDPVIAAGEGKVVYAGSGLRGYGELVIIKHNTVFLSAYAHNRKILVKEGQQVSRGQKIAEMGNTDADSVKLHFEIRKQGKPVDPAQYLPKR